MRRADCRERHVYILHFHFEFFFLQECTLTSKERRRALRITQGPRSRASLAAPPCHSSLQTNHMGLGGTYSSALEDWLLTRHKTSNSVSHHFPLCDSVPDLTGFNENMTTISTNHSAPRKIPFNNNSRYSANANGYPLAQNNSYSNGYCNSPARLQNNKNANVVDYDDDNEVQLRRNAINNRRCENGNEKEEWLYRRPTGPADIRHSCKYNRPKIVCVCCVSEYVCERVLAVCACVCE